MKNILCALSLCLCMSTQLIGQFSYGLRVTASPTVNPGTNYIVVNRGLAGENLFNISNVQYSPQLGLMGRYNIGQFWFMSELLYGQSTSTYSMTYTHGNELGSPVFNMSEKRSFLEMPVSVGVSIGVVEFFSGVTLSYDLKNKSELDEMEGFRSSVPALHYGWHSGVGVNLGRVLIDIRYAQEFGNYGEGRYINDQELLLKNAPARLMASAAFRI